MTFKFYIVDEDGTVESTNSASAAKQACEDDSIIAVIDVDNNVDMKAGPLPIRYQSNYSE